MRKLSFFVLASAALLASAQSKIDFNGRLAIEKVRELQLASQAGNGEITMSPMSTAVQAAAQVFTVIVEFNDNNIDFGDVEVEVVSQLGSLAVVNATASQIEQLATLDQVKQIALGEDKNMAMYIARPYAFVDEVQTGAEGLNQTYTGKGVVAGLYDVGLDVNHINFLNADGEPRTQRVWTYTSGGRETAYTTPSQIKNFTTENNGESHGTHVLGIMAGSYNGPAKYTVIGGDKNNKAVLVEQDEEGSAIPFYGVATETELAVACGSLADGNITAGVQRIVEYAESVNKPCVVNISIGSTLGPHDGTDAITKYIGELGKRAIICIAAGNEGNDNVSIQAKGKTIQTFVNGTSSSGAGTVQFWGSDERPFTVRFVGYDRSKGKEVFSYTLDENLGGKSVNQTKMDGFSSAFSGSITLSSNVGPSNDRYNVSANVSVSGITASILPAFVIEAGEDQVVNGYGYNMVFLSNSVPGFTNGNANNSISSMACGPNVVVVGSFATAGQWATFTTGGASITGYNPRPTVGAISGFSSYGETFQGKKLPDVCAPGEGIISSYSQYYVSKAPASATQGWLMGEYTAPKGLTSRNSPWGIMQGTSMACPFVAGVVGMWLEADPTLNIDDVQDVIAKTAITDFYTRSKPTRFGAGKIDALSGIKEVISRSGISDVVADSKDMFVTAIDGRNFEVCVPGVNGVSAALYSLSGNCVASASSRESSVNISADAAAPGVYLLRISGGNDTQSKKIVIK